MMRENQLKYIDAEGMRVITNSKYVAEQVKIDKEEKVVMGEPKIGEFGRNERQHNLKSIARDGAKPGKVGKLENCKIDEEMCRRSEEILCKSRSRETQS